MNDIIQVDSVTQNNEFLNVRKLMPPLVSVIHHKDLNFDHKFFNGRFAINLYHISLKDGATCSFGYGRTLYDFQEGTIIFTLPIQNS